MRISWKLLAMLATVAGAPATAAPWWYAGHAGDRAVFVDAGSVERDGQRVDFASKEVIRRQGDPVAMRVKFMRADCAGRVLGWVGVQRFGHDEAVIDTSTRRAPEMAKPDGPIAQAELDFACSDAAAREAAGYFPLTIDDAAFTAAVLDEANAGQSPRAVHDRLAADGTVPVVRSSAPPPASFGKKQTVPMGQPMVPPRDYARGPQVPDPRDHDAIEVGRIYDIAYQGIKNGEMQFEVRGYSIDDLVHPGSGQTETFRLGTGQVHIRDLAFTIEKALPDRITYSVTIDSGSGTGPGER